MGVLRFIRGTPSSAGLQTAAKGLVRMWLTDPASVQLHKETSVTAQG
jgi:hypothetical protein